MTSTPIYVERGYRLNRLTAGTGGIRTITSRKLHDGSKSITITGVLLPPIPRSDAPNYNKRLPTGRMIGLPTYEIAHLWGPGFGDEAWDGMMYAPREVNQAWQNRGIEGWLRGLRTGAEREGATVELTATACSHADTWQGSDLLSEVAYVFSLVSGPASRWVGRVELSVGPPDAPDVSPLIQVLPV